MTRDQFETALDRGALQIALRFADPTRPGKTTIKWYTCRRNGKTKTWKTDPNRFEIPLKYRYNDTTRVKSSDFPQRVATEFSIAED